MIEEAKNRRGTNNGMNKDTYGVLIRRYAPPSPLWKNGAKAFVCGGSICTLAQLGLEALQRAGVAPDTGRLLVMIALIALTALFTALGWFDKLAKHAGAGTAVPITGFANAVVSPAMEAKSEGFVLGTAAQMFSIAGPVLVFGCGSAALYGLLYYLLQKGGR